jgi:DedD protein
MALFKNRKGSDAPIAASPAESVEVLRRRARHRLIGAVVLVLAAVVGFPLIFDTQPRPVAVDIPIEIPDRNKAKPLPAPAAKAAATASVAAPRAEDKPAPEAAVPTGAGLDAREEVVASKVESKSTQTPVKSTSDAIKTEAIPKPPAVKPTPEVKPVTPAAAAAVPTGDRFVVQVGAFADAAKALEARRKLEKAGLKTYAQVVDTKDGKRTRVRVGPFAQRADADKAASKIKGLDLPAAVLTL